jgi:predicted AAA+ superfamily ATPase
MKGDKMKASAKKASPVTTVLEFDQEAIKRREKEVAQETDQQILERLGERFEILTEMTKAVKAGDVRAMIVSGPPGVGKSYGVEAVLQKDGLFDTLAERKPKYEVVKGAMSSIGLYAKLYEHSDAKHVVVFDDCDSILMEDLSLNILKGALDSSERRFISWNTDSRLLRSEGIPDRFEFKGAAIFITNIKFEHVRSKKLRDHLDALESRCHYIDLQMDTSREKILRIQQVVKENEMLADYEFEPCVQDELIEFVVENQDKLRELSLRMVLKLADLRKAFPANWKSHAKTTCMKRA